jgi:hypothetical protein
MTAGARGNSGTGGFASKSGSHVNLSPGHGGGQRHPPQKMIRT